MINIFQPSLGEAELDAVRDVFTSNWLGHGPRSRAFEAAFAAHVGVDPDHVVFVNSCTAALFLSTELLELGPGDDVVLPSLSFVGAGNAVAATGARAVFCDVDEHTLNPTVADVERALTPATRAVVLLHYGGYPGEVEQIARMLNERGVALIEDAACAVASSVDGRVCGSFGDIATWSFDAMKILVTGDGGMLYVRDAELAHRARQLAYHGLETASGFSNARVPQRWWELDVREHGRRVIGNDLTAAIGKVQLARLPEFVAARAAVTESYDGLLAGLPGVHRPPRLPAGHVTSHYFYWIQVNPAVRDRVAADLREQGVYTTFRYPPLHRVPIYDGADHALPATDRAAESTLLLPIHQRISTADTEHVVRVLRDSMSRHASSTVA